MFCLVFRENLIFGHSFLFIKINKCSCKTMCIITVHKTSRGIRGVKEGCDRALEGFSGAPKSMAGGQPSPTRVPVSRIKGTV